MLQTARTSPAEADHQIERTKGDTVGRTDVRKDGSRSDRQTVRRTCSETIRQTDGQCQIDRQTDERKRQTD